MKLSHVSDTYVFVPEWVCQYFYCTNVPSTLLKSKCKRINALDGKFTLCNSAEAERDLIKFQGRIFQRLDFEFWVGHLDMFWNNIFKDFYKDNFLCIGLEFSKKVVTELE